VLVVATSQGLLLTLSVNSLENSAITNAATAATTTINAASKGGVNAVESAVLCSHQLRGEPRLIALSVWRDSTSSISNGDDSGAAVSWVESTSNKEEEEVEGNNLSTDKESEDVAVEVVKKGDKKKRKKKKSKKRKGSISSGGDDEGGIEVQGLDSGTDRKIARAI